MLRRSVQLASSALCILTACAMLALTGARGLAEPGRLAQPSTVKTPTHRAAVATDFNYARTWEMTYTDLEGVPQTARFTVASASCPPQAKSRDLPVFLPSHWVSPNGDQVLGWSEMSGQSFTTPTILLMTADRYVDVNFTGSGSAKDPNLILGHIRYRACPRQGGACRDKLKEASVTAVGGPLAVRAFAGRLRARAFDPKLPLR